MLLATGLQGCESPQQDADEEYRAIRQEVGTGIAMSTREVQSEFVL